MTSRKSLRSNSTGETDMAIEANTKVITPEAILSYPNLIEPRADDSDKLWYQCSLVFLPETDISALKQAVLDCAKARCGAKAGVGPRRGWGGASPSSSRGSPWRLGTPTAGAPGSPRVGIQWARRRGADHRSGNWDCVEQGTT